MKIQRRFDWQSSKLFFKLINDNLFQGFPSFTSLYVHFDWEEITKSISFPCFCPRKYVPKSIINVRRLTFRQDLNVKMCQLTSFRIKNHKYINLLDPTKGKWKLKCWTTFGNLFDVPLFNSMFGSLNGFSSYQEG